MVGWDVRHEAEDGVVSFVDLFLDLLDLNFTSYLIGKTVFSED